jgi:NAD(P) transhydrogenase subunit alpha
MEKNEKPIIVGVPSETFPGENRIALVPDIVDTLIKSGLKVLVETDAGKAAGLSDEQYTNKGAEIISERKDLFSSSDIIIQVRGTGANPDSGRNDIDLMHSGQTLIGFHEPLSPGTAVKEVAENGVNILAMELIPRITRAQSMDALSSMATVAGYKAVILAAEHLPRMFPMLMTAAGTVSPARVFVIGAGVAGLQAIATAKRLGAIVKGYDIRPAVKEQVESLGARFVEIDVRADDAEDKGGYAREMDDEFYRKQRELLTRVVAESDVVITTAAVPGKKAPILITGEMVRGMASRSVIVDLAAERGGNCELTRPGKEIIDHGVTILGPENLPATIPYHASQMYSRNVSALLMHLIKDGTFTFDMEDEITRETLVSKDGRIIHPLVRKIMGLSEDNDSERSA